MAILVDLLGLVENMYSERRSPPSGLWDRVEIFKNGGCKGLRELNNCL